MFGWISVKERLPEVKLAVNKLSSLSKLCLVHTSDSYDLATYWVDTDNSIKTGWYDEENNLVDVHFWSVLPPHPIEL